MLAPGKADPVVQYVSKYLIDPPTPAVLPSIGSSEPWAALWLPVLLEFTMFPHLCPTRNRASLCRILAKTLIHSD